MREALVVRHIAFEDLGNLAEVLTERKFAVTYVEAGLDNLTSVDPLGLDLLIILGGPIGVYEEDRYPFLKDELHLLERRLTAELPTLGICLGSQLMARALGADVYSGPRKEIGWSPLVCSDAGRHSCLSHLSADKTAVLHWHGDTFDLPTGATLLASTLLYENQAFSWGKGWLALQFHPEVMADSLERWFIGHTHEIGMTPGVSVMQLRQDTRLYANKLQIQAAKVWEAWLKEVFG